MAKDGNGNELGAGDQGMMFGYASAETHCHMPLAIYLAREIIHVLEADREMNSETPLLPDLHDILPLVSMSAPLKALPPTSLPVDVPAKKPLG